MEIMNYIKNDEWINKMEEDLLVELANDKNDDNSEALDIFYDSKWLKYNIIYWKRCEPLW